MKHALYAAAVLALLLTAARAQQSPRQSIAPPRDLGSPAGASSAQPQLTVSSDGRVILSWLEDTGSGKARAFRYAVRDSAGWSSPVTIVERANFFVNWADVPSVFPIGGGRLVAHWLQYNGTGTYAYDVRMSVSDAQGRNWSPDEAPHKDGTNTEHGFASFFALPGGGAGAVWLDGREMKTSVAGGHGGGAMTLRTARIAPDGAIGADTRIDTRVCECCPTAAVATTRGALVAYRDRSDTEVRDIAVLRYESGTWHGPAYAQADNWQINACPVNGPSLAAVGDRVALAWFTAEGDRPRVNVAFSQDAGRTWGKPVRVDEAKSLGRVASAMLDDGRAVVLWMEHLENGSELRARVVHPDGRREPYITVSSTTADRTSGYARMVRSGNELIFAWVSSRPAPHIQTAVATLR